MAKLVDKRYKWPKEKRKFGGETYTYLLASASKREAESDAERWRNKGWRIRIVPFGRAYALYHRGGR